MKTMYSNRNKVLINISFSSLSKPYATCNQDRNHWSTIQCYILFRSVAIMIICCIIMSVIKSTRTSIALKLHHKQIQKFGIFIFQPNDLFHDRSIYSAYWNVQEAFYHAVFFFMCMYIL